MWDYNIGLVRTTHLFKCNDYSKVRNSEFSLLNTADFRSDDASEDAQRKSWTA